MDAHRRSLEKKQEMLREELADVHLAILMDDYALEEGKKIHEEMRLAAERGDLQDMPEDFERRCLELIDSMPIRKEPRHTLVPVIRNAVAALLVVIVFCGAILGVQAAGFNILGILATWTNSIFRFVDESEPTRIAPSDGEEENEIQVAFKNLGFPTEYSPTWFPDGYQISDIQEDSNEFYSSVTVLAEAEGKSSIIISILKGSNGFTPFDVQWEKNDADTEVFTINNKSFYLFKNETTWSSVWSDGVFTLNFVGFETKKDITTFIRNLGGFTK